MSRSLPPRHDVIKELFNKKDREVSQPGIRIERFSLRRGSGGRGLYPGGDGVVRQIKFLRPAEVSIISERRVTAPYGVKGGGSGKKGENLLIRADGKIEKLPHRAFVRVNPGESVIIKTPGGGGRGLGEGKAINLLNNPRFSDNIPRSISKPKTRIFKSKIKGQCR